MSSSPSLPEPSADLDDQQLARALAGRTGEVLLDIRRQHVEAAAGAELDARALKDAGDQGAQAVLAELLGRCRPDDAVLSEEAPDDQRRVTADRVWIIDPLDGTREFSEVERTDWAVHVALWVRDPDGADDPAADPPGRLAAGAVALPGLGVVLGADAPPARAAAATPPRILVSRTRPPAEAEHVAQALGAVLVPMGSAGAKVAAVVRGEAEAYVHSGGQYQWDSAAPMAVARAAGLHTSRLDGSPLVYNSAVRSLPDLVVCHPDLAGPVMDALHDRPVHVA